MEIVNFLFKNPDEGTKAESEDSAHWKMHKGCAHILCGLSGCSESLWFSGYSNPSSIDTKTWTADFNLTDVQLDAMAEQHLSLQVPGSPGTAPDASSLQMVWEIHFHGRERIASVSAMGYTCSMKAQWTLSSPFILHMDREKYGLGSENITGQFPHGNFSSSGYSLKE